jgi:hypothetical protein
MAQMKGKVKTVHGFAETNHDAAGIDVGNAQHWVSSTFAATHCARFSK